MGRYEDLISFGIDILSHFFSSKTASEISSIQRKIKSRGLLVCENGGAIVETRPNENSMLKSFFGRPRATWMPQLIKLRQELGLNFKDSLIGRCLC